MDISKWKLPLDATASSLAHRAVDELQVVSSGKKVLIYPNWGAFYGDTISYYSVEGATNSLWDVVNNKNVAIELMQLDTELSALTGRAVHRCFALDLSSFNGFNNFKITYQTPGGDTVINRYELDKINKDLFGVRTIEYKNILGLPGSFDPKPHTERAQLAYGLIQLKERLDSITALVDTQDEQHVQMHEKLILLFTDRFNAYYNTFNDDLIQKDSLGNSVYQNSQKTRALQYSKQVAGLITSVNDSQRDYYRISTECDKLNNASGLYKQVLDWVINYQWWDAAKAVGDYVTASLLPFVQGTTANALYVNNKIYIASSSGIYIGDGINPFVKVASYYVYKLMYDGTKFYMVGNGVNGSYISQSVDCITWVPLYYNYVGGSVTYINTPGDICKIGNYFITPSKGSNVIYRWTNGTDINSINTASINYRIGFYCAASTTSVVMVTGPTAAGAYNIDRSTDNGASYTPITSTAQMILALAYNNNTFVCVGKAGSITVSLDDGATWQNIAHGLTTIDFSYVAWSGTNWFIGGATGMIKCNANFTANSLVTSTLTGYSGIASDNTNKLYHFGNISTSTGRYSSDSGANWTDKASYRTSEGNVFTTDALPSTLTTETNQVNSVLNLTMLTNTISPYNNDTGTCLHANANCAYMTEAQALANSQLKLVYKNTSYNASMAGPIKHTVESVYANSFNINSTATPIYTSRNIVLDATTQLYTKGSDPSGGVIDQSTTGFGLFAVMRYEPNSSFTLICHINGDLYIASHPDAGKAIGIYNASTGKWLAHKWAPFKPKQDTIIGLSYSIDLKHLYFYVYDEAFTPDQKCSVDCFDQTALNAITKFDPSAVFPVGVNHPYSKYNNPKRIFKQITVFNKFVSVPVFLLCHKKFLYSHYAGLNNKNPLVSMAKHDVKFYR